MWKRSGSAEQWEPIQQIIDEVLSGVSYMDDAMFLIIAEPNGTIDTVKAATESIAEVFAFFGFILNMGPAQTAVVIAAHGGQSRQLKHALHSEYNMQITCVDTDS